MVKKLKPEKSLKILTLGHIGLLLASIGVIIYSLYVGGWRGIGFGLLGMTIFIGALIGALLSIFINFVSKDKPKDDYRGDNNEHETTKKS